MKSSNRLPGEIAEQRLFENGNRTEGDGGFRAPGTIFGDVWDLPGIMGREAGVYVLGETDAMAIWIGFGNGDVDLVKFAQFGI